MVDAGLWAEAKATATPPVVEPVTPVTPSQPPVPRSERVRGMVGVAVGVLVGLAVLGAVVYAVWRGVHRVRKGRKVVRGETPPPVEVSVETGRTELPDSAVVRLHELETVERFEMGAGERWELDGAGEVGEDGHPPQEATV